MEAYRGLLDALSCHSSELAVLGSDADDRKSLADRFNIIRKSIISKQPDDDIWTIITEVDENTPLSEIKLNCNLLIRYLDDVNEKAKKKVLWRIDRDTEFQGVYNSDVIVEPGITFLCHGVVNGKVTVKRGASLLNDGVLNGGLDMDNECTFSNTGVLGGQIRYIEVGDM